jgi:hypothetical protein
VQSGEFWVANWVGKTTRAHRITTPRLHLAGPQQCTVLKPPQGTLRTARTATSLDLVRMILERAGKAAAADPDEAIRSVLLGFVRRNWRTAPYFDVRLGVGRIDAKGPLGVPYA